MIAIFVAVAVPIYFDRKQRLDEQQTEANQKQKFLLPYPHHLPTSKYYWCHQNPRVRVFKPDSGIC